MTVSPDFLAVNVSNAANEPPPTGREPVEIFQAELVALLEQLALGIPFSSGADADDEGESRDKQDDRNEESGNGAPAVDVRPAVLRLPEFRPVLSLDFVGRAEPVTGIATAETADAPEMPDLVPPSETLPAVEAPEAPVSFEAAIRPREERPIEHAGVPKMAIDPVMESKPAEQKRDAETHSDSQSHNGAAAKARSARSEVRDVLEVAPESLERREPAAPQTHAVSESLESWAAARPGSKSEPKAASKPAHSVETIPPVRVESSLHAQPLREVSLGLTSEQSRVAVQVRELDGTLQVSVRTPDAALSASLQRNLDELAINLGSQGMDAQLWTPAEQKRIEAHAADLAGDPGQSPRDTPGGSGHGGGANSQQNHNHRSRPEWLDALGAEAESELKKEEVTRWTHPLLINRTRR